METSLRYASVSKSLKIHAKEVIPMDYNAQLQFRGELDTRSGVPTYMDAMIRQYYPKISADVGVGVQYDWSKDISYFMRGKKSFPVSSDEFVNFNIKGRGDFDAELKKSKFKGAVEFSWSILNIKKDQDVTVKVGYEVVNKAPYFQVRENNWTFNANANGRWNVRYAL